MLAVLKRLIDHTDDNKTHEIEEHELKVATCTILLEAAIADEHFSAEEQRSVIEILKSKFQMTDQAVLELIEESKKHREDSIDLWYFTNIINANLGNEEKYKLMELVWEVIYSDGKLDKFENYIAQKLYRMLNIDHSKFIELKMEVKNRMA